MNIHIGKQARQKGLLSTSLHEMAEKNLETQNLTYIKIFINYV